MSLLATLTQRRLEPVQRFDGYRRKFTGAVKLRSTTSLGNSRLVGKKEPGVL
jgi:hypothetical protein